VKKIEFHREKLKALERENRELRQANEILGALPFSVEISIT
jgi:hypothetical protein